jgi:catechol 2,3-dioxygenase-like lactoylglutathione lyase family enzyme
VGNPTLSVEVITLPVSDFERALRFYVDQVGFTLDVDYSPNDAFRVVQLTPAGSSCSIQIGNGLTDAPVGFTSQRISRRHGPRGRADSPARTWCRGQ